MQAPALRRDLAVGPSQIGIEFSHVDDRASRCILLIPHAIQIKLLRLPSLSVFGKPCRIRSYLERFLCDDARYLVMTVSIARRAGKPRNDDLRPVIANDAHE